MEWTHTVVVGSLCVVQAVFSRKVVYLPNLHMNCYVVPSSISIINSFFVDSSIQTLLTAIFVLSKRKVFVISEQVLVQQC